MGSPPLRSFVFYFTLSFLKNQQPFSFSSFFTQKQNLNATLNAKLYRESEISSQKRIIKEEKKRFSYDNR